DESLRASIRELGPDTIFVSKLSIVSISGGTGFAELMRRPNLTIADAEAIERLAPSAGIVDVMLGGGPGAQVSERAQYRGTRTPPLSVIGATEEFASVNFIRVAIGRFFT